MLVVAFCFTTTLFAQNKKTIRVGVFQGHGGAETCIWEAVQAVRLDGDMTVRTFTTADIAKGVLNNLDAIIVPGGGGSTQYLSVF